ncbi:MAG: hypothetical protein HZA95_03150 [Candidatus Vogelbacteria bacterium]|nr:hypothetical protein [Candidatus Vogelbacteria bacterium]
MRQFLLKVHFVIHSGKDKKTICAAVYSPISCSEGEDRVLVSEGASSCGPTYVCKPKKDDDKKLPMPIVDSRLLEKKAPNGLVILRSIYPEKGTVGMPLKITGSGFTKTNNTIVFDNGYTLHVPSSDLTTINFNVPEDRAPLCTMTNPQCLLPAPYNPVTSGEYKIYVGNANGWSDGMRFTVIKQEDLKEDPYQAVYNDSICKEMGNRLMGCHLMSENPAVRFDGSMMKYLYIGTSIVRSCATEPVTGCSRTEYDYHRTSSKTSTSTMITATSTTENTTTTDVPTCMSWQYLSGNTCVARSTTDGNASARAFRGGLYFSSAWMDCMERLGSGTDMRRVQEFLNTSTYPYPWNSLTAKGQGDTGTCEREAGWNWNETTTASSTTSNNNNWSSHTWRFKDDSTPWSYILNRTDAEYTNFISGIDTVARDGYFNGWKSDAGNSTAANWQNFGIPIISLTPTQTVRTGCSDELKALLGTGCHNMGNAYFDSPMNRYVMPGTTVVKNCSSDNIQGCTTTGGGSGNTTSTGSSGSGSSSSTGGSTWSSSNQREQVWNSLGLRSWVRSDTDQSRVDSLKAACASVSSGSNIWQSGAGDYANSDFGMPDPTKCSAASACASGTYYNGSSCAAGSGSGYSSGSGSWTSGSGSSSGAWSSCTSGQYWNGNACVAGSYSTDPATGCAQAGGTWQGGSNYCQMPNSGGSSWSSGSGSSCGSGQYWNGSACVATSPSDTPSTSCGSGYYWNGSSCQANTTSGSATSCGSGQYWNGSACISSSSGSTSGSSNYSSDPATACGQAGGTWNSSTSYCQMPGTSGGTSGSTSVRNAGLSQLANILYLLQEMVKKLPR